MSPKTILVTGASGFLGWTLCQHLQDQYRVIGIYFRQRPTDRPNIQWERINLMQTPLLRPLMERLKPDAVLHLAAISNTTFCQEHPAMSHHINVYATVALAEIAEQQGIPFLFASSDLVFNGHSAPYEETDFTYPISQYGQQKQAAEELLLTEFDQTLVGRLPLLFGPAPSYGRNFFVNSVDALKKGGSVYAFADEYRSITSTTAAAEWWKRALAYALDEEVSWSKKERLLHLSSSEGASRYDFMVQVAQQLGVNPLLVQKGTRQQAPNPQTRPADVRLDNRLARKLFKYEPPTLVKQIHQVL